MMQTTTRKAGGERERANEPRPASARPEAQSSSHLPPAGAHAADHLVNADLTPGAGVLPSADHKAGKEVDGAAG